LKTSVLKLYIYDLVFVRYFVTFMYLGKTQSNWPTSSS